MKTFVDTGAWYAVADTADQFHSIAVKHFNCLLSNKVLLYTTNLVIHETVMLLSRKVSKSAAILFLDTIYNDENVSIVENQKTIEKRGFRIFKKYDDQDFSITDCVSFVVLKDLKIKRVFSFDRHFSIMKFTLEPLM